MKKVLIIEDDANIRSNVAEMLELANYQTLGLELLIQMMLAK